MRPNLRIQAVDKEWRREGRQSAVCMLFAQRDGEEFDHLVLTRRTTTVGTHKGQIGFPGGRADEGDRGPAETALRELEEELGVPHDQVELLGQLPNATALDRAPVIPIAMRTSLAIESMLPSPDEVAAVLHAPWPLFTQAASKPFSFNIYGVWRESILYTLPSRDRVWGLTARMIYDANLQAP